MDYIREELLRHRSALFQLMLGQSAESTDRGQDPAEEMTAAVETAALESEEALFRAGRRLAAGEDMQTMWGNAGEEIWERDTVFERNSLPKEYHAARFTAGRSAGSSALYLPVMTETLRTAGEETSAGELSRVFQRDARRYDGGFTLY